MERCDPLAYEGTSSSTLLRTIIKCLSFTWS